MAMKYEPLCQFSDRLCFTTFPSPTPSPEDLNRAPSEAGNNPRVRSPSNLEPPATPDDDATYYYFSIEHQLRYLSFFQDWGPLNLAMVYKACILIHELLEDENLASHKLVLYSSDDPRHKANSALLMALYVMIVQRRAPWEAFHPIAKIEFMPFRDAGRGLPDFNLSIQDCLWGVWKAMQNGLCDMNEFSVEDYEHYEKVENGDWNWITPNFIAFASPLDSNWLQEGKHHISQPQMGTPTPASPRRTSASNLALQRPLPTAFMNCLDYFERRNIKLVVRLNMALYDKTLFLERGIEHMELYFDDGTNPTDEIVRKFIEVSDRIVEDRGVIAVHCKAGLGRTGTLIGAYLIWKYGFTANEAIAFMRIVRPGSVVGPQQQYMYLKQLEWVKWAAADEVRRHHAPSVPLAKPTPVTPATPPAEMDDVMEDIQLTPTTEVRVQTVPPVTPSRHVAEAAAKAKAIATPGQPRKTPVSKRVHTLESDDEEIGEADVLPSLEIGPIRRKRTSPRTAPTSEARPTRVTRSTAVASLIKRSTTTSASTPSVQSSYKQESTKGVPPNKIPRLAVTRSAAAAKAAAAASVTQRARAIPAPSRLPTLSPTKRSARQNGAPVVEIARNRKEIPKPLDEVANAAGLKLGAKNDAWMKNNADAVVTHPKSGRPGLRPIRRRRSSFSAADVVA